MLAEAFELAWIIVLTTIILAVGVPLLIFVISAIITFLTNLFK